MYIEYVIMFINGVYMCIFMLILNILLFKMYFDMI